MKLPCVTPVPPGITGTPLSSFAKPASVPVILTPLQTQMLVIGPPENV